MRLRKKPWVAEALQAYGDVVLDSGGIAPGQWRSRCGGSELHVEIGTGRGRFISGMAEQQPGTVFVGIEAAQDVLYDAARKVREQGLDNVRLLVFNALAIETLFSPGEVDRLYLNFSDPWHKRRHAKRRLTHAVFLAKYRQIIKPGGRICFKTDNEKLFEFSLNQFADFGLRLANISFDLHNSGFEGNIMTEYEAKFSERGNKIFRCEAVF
ncbi:MAG: tRNA (guanosine(46)-N7)-methyltransferase TrmB [Sporomusaceae bacterium]|nr:tRNA (guanosine(46)-N7)-methyltransferase TrmB [Sporomusaceae bacterium]